MKKSKRAMRLIFKGSLDEIDEDKIYEESFSKLTPQERLEEAWELVKHAWKLKGKSSDELRLNRTVVLIKRV